MLRTDEEREGPGKGCQNQITAYKNRKLSLNAATHPAPDGDNQ